MAIQKRGQIDNVGEKISINFILNIKNRLPLRILCLRFLLFRITPYNLFSYNFMTYVPDYGSLYLNLFIFVKVK